MTDRVCFVAAPLIARSGVYNSTIELVTEARRQGLDWSAVIGVARTSTSAPTAADGVREFPCDPGGGRGIVRLSRAVSSLPEVRAADLIVTMVPQSDMALALTGLPWVAYLRGLPWPAAGESSRARALLWRFLERRALSRATDVWSTTRLLAASVDGIDTRIVPPGLVPPAAARRSAHPEDFVWAARYSHDKNPDLFLQALRGAPGAHGVMFGGGPLEDSLRARTPENVEVRGWCSRDELWGAARAYVGTSSREAFGRSAVEAAMQGIPVIISREFGCAELLYTDHDLAQQFVLPLDEVAPWSHAIERLGSDDALHARAGEHVRQNAARLTISSAVSNVRHATRDVLSRDDPSRR